MAESYPTPPTQTETVINEINEAFDHLIQQLNNRRQALINELLRLSEENTAKREAKKNKIKELNRAKINIQIELRHNLLRETQDRFICDINEQLNSIEESFEETSPTFEYSNEKLEAEIFCFGNIIKKKGLVTNYLNRQPIIAVGKRGDQPGEINHPRGIAFCKETKQIFIADGIAYIHIYSEDGVFIKRIGQGAFKCPYGVAVFKNNLYVTDTELHAIILLALPDCKVVYTVKKLELFRGKKKIKFDANFIHGFNCPNSLTVAINGDVYITDNGNNRIVVMDMNLGFKHQIMHAAIIRPTDVKIHGNNLFILCDSTDPIIHVFSLTGDYFNYSIISSEQVKKCLFFCIDVIGNIILGDMNDHNIKVFNKKGNLINIIGKRGHEKGEFYEPAGVMTTLTGKLITLSYNKNFRLQFFK